MTSPERVMQFLKWSFVVSGVMLIIVVIRIPSRGNVAINPASEALIAFMALVSSLAGFCIRPLLCQMAIRSSSREAGGTPLARWNSANIISLAFLDATMLFGVVLHFLHARLWLVEVVLGVGMTSLVLWSAGKSPGNEDSRVI